MEGITFKIDEDLKDIDLSVFEIGFKKTMDLVYKQVSTVIGTKKIFSKDIVKKILLEEDGEDAFSSKISMNKNRSGNLSINMYMQSPNGVICFIWKKEYETKGDLEEDIDYIISYILNIQENTQEV